MTHGWHIEKKVMSLNNATYSKVRDVIDAYHGSFKSLNLNYIYKFAKDEHVLP